MSNSKRPNPNWSNFLNKERLNWSTCWKDTSSFFIEIHEIMYSQTCVQRAPSGPQFVTVVDKWWLFKDSFVIQKLKTGLSS